MGRVYLSSTYSLSSVQENLRPHELTEDVNARIQNAPVPTLRLLRADAHGCLLTTALLEYISQMR